MTKQARTSRVLLALIGSMTIGALILMALDGGPISEGPYSLVGQIIADRIQKEVINSIEVTRHPWDNIEVFYSGTATSDVDQLISHTGSAGDKEPNFHFVVCNAVSGVDGQIQYTSRWQQQNSCVLGTNFKGTENTIRICLIADGLGAMPTAKQKEKTADLVKLFRSYFSIPQNQIAYPSDWN